MKENYVEPMVVDKNGNIYYSAKCINELEDEKSKEIERLTKIANALEKELIDTYEFETGDTMHIKEVIKQIKEEI